MGLLRRARVACLSALLIADGARAADFRGSLTAGLGVGHDIAGLQLELGAGHWSGFASLGPLGFSSVALGARWSLRPDGSGFGAALQAAVWKTSGDSSPYTNDRETMTLVSATAHWRWIWHFLLVDLGAGPAATFDSYRYPTYTDSFTPADGSKLVRTGCLGLFIDLGRCKLPLDLELGLGLAF